MSSVHSCVSVASLYNGVFVCEFSDTYVTKHSYCPKCPSMKTASLSNLAKVLRSGRQCDESGEEVIMSRQACCEAADLLDSFDKIVSNYANIYESPDSKVY